MPGGQLQSDITFYFLLPRRCAGSSIGLGLWVQIGTADGGSVRLRMPWCLAEGCDGHTPHTFPLIVAVRLQRKGGEGQADCAGSLVKWL